MAVMSIRIDDNKRKALKVIASIEGKTIGALISDMIDDYVRKNRKKIIKRYEEAEIMEIIMLSDSAFSEWDNEEDDIYNDL
jgi:hypothetical protein